MGKQREVWRHWRKIAPVADQEWQWLVDEVSQDGRLHPAMVSGEVEQLYSGHVLHNASFTHK